MKVRAHEIKHALSIKHERTNDFFLTEVKSGPTQLGPGLSIIDALAIRKSWTNPCITGYEIKVSRSDFLSDNKWPAYRGMCHRLYFACPTGLINPDEVPEDVGLVWYNPKNKRVLHTRKKSMHRGIEMPENMLYYVIMNRLDNDRHPFFGSKREYLRGYLADRITCKQLGYEVKSKMLDDLVKLEKERDEFKRRAARSNDDVELLEKLNRILIKHGISTLTWQVEKELDEALSSSIPPRLKHLLDRIKTASDELQEITEGREGHVRDMQ